VSTYIALWTIISLQPTFAGEFTQN
jgi:hypothetical protein